MASPIDAMIQALRKRFSPPPESDAELDARAANARATSEEVSKRLPKAVMPRDAIEKERQRMAMIDQQLRDAER
ncbi:hypothetical protein [Anaeromyxobacter oryzisoli]|uniref:hypothetical protein n=1 Tax=Anaeromyxobacter oryzisoli TaxID=2925408 RepID=UPI001F59727D|nr:hypothetical protein [Anaeromyxobacter sp. SG63]